MEAVANQRQKTISSKEIYSSENQRFVLKLAWRIYRKCPPYIELQDLIQAAWVGLLEASRKYDSSNNSTFFSYALHRVNGAMLDFLRQSDSSKSRSAKALTRLLDTTRDRLRHASSNGGSSDAIDDEAMAKELGQSLEDYYKSVSAVRRVVTREKNPNAVEQVEDPSALSRFQFLENQIYLQRLMHLSVFGKQQKNIILLCLSGKSQKEIAISLRLTESRISQIMHCIRDKLDNKEL